MTRPRNLRGHRCPVSLIFMGQAVFLAAVLLATAFVHAAGVAGSFSGDWTGTAASGDFRIKIAESDGRAVFEVSFTIGGQEVKTQVTSGKVEGERLEATYEFTLGEQKLQSAITGRLAGSQLTGSYKTTTVPGGAQVDEGSWKASKKE